MWRKSVRKDELPQVVTHGSQRFDVACRRPAFAGIGPLGIDVSAEQPVRIRRVRVFHPLRRVVENIVFDQP